MLAEESDTAQVSLCSTNAECSQARDVLRLSRNEHTACLSWWEQSCGLDLLGGAVTLPEPDTA